MKCNICNLDFIGKRGLTKHLAQKHKFNREQQIEYYLSIDNKIKLKDNKKFIKCEICENYYESLQSHLKKHNISCKEYKNKYKTEIFSKEIIEVNKNKCINIWKNKTEKEKKEFGRKIAEIRFKNNTNGGGRKKGFKHTKEWKENHKELMLKNNPFKGKKHSQETKEKMKKNHVDFRGDKNPFKNSLKDPKKREEHKKRCKNIWKTRDTKWRKNFAEKLSRILANSNKTKNRNCCSFYKSCFVYYYDKIMFCRSSWEEKIASFLYSHPIVYSFDLEPFCIKYESNKGKRYTRIDFEIYLTNNKLIIFEVKPSVFAKKSLDKINGIVNFCLENNYEFYLIDESLINKDRFNKFLWNVYNNKFQGEWFKILNWEFNYDI